MKTALVWMRQAACLKSDPRLFFPDHDASARRIEEAVSFCRVCPVQSQCLAYAKENKETEGIWGGHLFGKLKTYRPNHRRRKIVSLL